MAFSLLAVSKFFFSVDLSYLGVQWYSWLKPFDVWLWLAILGTCNVILVVVWWFDRKSPTGHHHILREKDEDGVTLLGKCCIDYSLRLPSLRTTFS